MYLIYAGSSYDIKQNKNVKFIGYKIRYIDCKGIEIVRYYSDNENGDIFYKEVEFKLELFSEKWEKRVFQLTREELKKELEDVPKHQKIKY